MIKTKINYLPLACLCLLAINPVFAEENGNQMEFGSKKFLEEKAALVEPGILPDSFWYWTDMFGEEIQFVFMVGREKRADFLINLANERLAELKVLSEKGVNNYTDQLISEHELKIERAEQLYNQVKLNAAKKVKKAQGEAEMAILKNEPQVKKTILDLPNRIMAKGNKGIDKTVSWFKGVLSHLSTKKQQINDQRAKISE